MPIRGDGLPIAGAAEDDAALAIPDRDGGGGGVDEVGVVAGLRRVRTKIDNLMAHRLQMSLDLGLISEARVVGSEGDFHGDCGLLSVE